MAHVLIPTDLSDNALNAAVYAVNLFGAEGNRFTVLHTYFAPPPGEGSIGDQLQAELYKVSEAGMAQFMTRLTDAVPDQEPEFRSITEFGNLAAVLSLAEESPDAPDLVVMGTQGASGLDRILLGSNTASAIQRLRTPVLAIPEQARYQPPKRIVLADDGGHVDKVTLKLLLDIARWSHAEVKIVHVVPEGTSPEEELNGSGYDVLLGAIPHSFHSVSGDNVIVALHDLADQSDADLVVVVHRHRGAFEQLFHRSVATRSAMHTHIPMLVLQQATS